MNLYRRNASPKMSKNASISLCCGYFAVHFLFYAGPLCHTQPQLKGFTSENSSAAPGHTSHHRLLISAKGTGKQHLSCNEEDIGRDVSMGHHGWRCDEESLRQLQEEEEEGKSISAPNTRDSSKLSISISFLSSHGSSL